jgi:hypothetical protein
LLIVPVQIANKWGIKKKTLQQTTTREERLSSCLTGCVKENNLLCILMAQQMEKKLIITKRNALTGATGSIRVPDMIYFRSAAGENEIRETHGILWT